MPISTEILKELRKDKGHTQETIGKLFNLSAGGYANYESGRRVMRVDMLEKLADELGTSTDYLLGRTAEQRPYPPRKQK